ncbi:MAG: acyl-CoA thioesterase [Peptococcaceae bacterium]|nr:acyl-CoA thioesterase [Peptococcaceae bacterium]
MNTSPYIRKVHYYETDQMGIVHHSNYIRWFEETRVDYMEQIGFGYQKAVETGIDFVVLSVSCDYKTMVRFGDTVKIFMTITSAELLRITLAYRIADNETGELRALGESKHCYYHSLKKRPVSLKKELPALYEIFQDA